MSAESQVNSTQVQVGPHAFPSLTQCIQDQALCPEPPLAPLSPLLKSVLAAEKIAVGLCALLHLSSHSLCLLC